MDIQFCCHSCGQNIEVNADGGGQSLRCPTCGTSLVVPRIVHIELEKKPPPIDESQYYNLPAERKQPYSYPLRQKESVAGGVFKGLFGFFVLLPLGIIAAIILFIILSSLGN